MRYALHDIQRLYRNHNLADRFDAPLRVSNALGTVWYAGRDRMLAGLASGVDAPWCLLGVVPAEQTDGVEDRLIVADAELARHHLAWRVDAPANGGNVFLAIARELALVARVDLVFPGRKVLISGFLVDPLGRAVFCGHDVQIDGIQLTRGEAAHTLAQLGLDSG